MFSLKYASRAVPWLLDLPLGTLILLPAQHGLWKARQIEGPIRNGPES
jgi:hypothetical protein